MNRRKSGVLMHLSSLPSPYGIGTMGAEARAFVDFLVEAGQSCWQLLPIGPTSYGDSPYQSFSTFAGNPYFLDLDQLAADGLLEPSDYNTIDWESSPDDINYGTLYEKRWPVLEKAVSRFLDHPADDFDAFCAGESWLDSYAFFMALKDAHSGRPWWEWDTPLRDRDPAALEAARALYAHRITFWKVIQYLFYHQWRALKTYANDRGISIIGDLPIYVSLDSAVVWASPELFQLDDHKLPTEVAGCPPDGFSADGQLWGNPLYNWEHMSRDGYTWWVDRLHHLCQIYDMLRIDHFRGFDEYYAIPFGDTTARNGRWRKGPGLELFHAVRDRLGEQPIIAEDLGFLTDTVRQLLAESGYPGMKVLEFAFDSRDGSGSDYLPHNYPVRCVAYAGTHDNEPIRGWMATADLQDVAYATAYLGLTQGEGYHWGMMRGLWASVAQLTIVQAQDLLGLGSESRMNTPSSVGRNWRWRALPGAFTPALASRVMRNMKLYGRLPR